MNVCSCDGSLNVLYECVRVKLVEKKSKIEKERDGERKKRRTGNRSFSLLTVRNRRMMMNCSCCNSCSQCHIFIYSRCYIRHYDEI